MSASIRPTRCPSFARLTARFTATVVLPTPPLPEPTATTYCTPGSACGPIGCCPVCPIRSLRLCSSSLLTTHYSLLLQMPLRRKRRTQLLPPRHFSAAHLAP